MCSFLVCDYVIGLIWRIKHTYPRAPVLLVCAYAISMVQQKKARHDIQWCSHYRYKLLNRYNNDSLILSIKEQRTSIRRSAVTITATLTIHHSKHMYRELNFLTSRNRFRSYV